MITQRPRLLHPPILSVTELDARLAAEMDRLLRETNLDEGDLASHAIRHGTLDWVRSLLVDWLAEEQRPDPDAEWQRLRDAGYSEADLRRLDGDR